MSAQQNTERNQQPTAMRGPEETEEEELGPPKADFSAPPPYELTNSNAMHNTVIAQNHSQLPLQSQTQLDQEQQSTLNTQQQSGQQQTTILMHHGKLPTYEEVQMEKSMNGELPPEFMNALSTPPPNPLLSSLRENNAGSSSAPALTFIAIDPSDSENLSNGDSSLLGTDIMFIMAFMVAFLFNWIGFLMLTCFCHTIAARYGALSGFGLSLAKWTLIVKNSTDLASHENSWLWWLIMAFGFLICVRALIQYVSIKRTWRLLSTSAQERLLFFY